MRTIETTIYKFDELNDAAKEKARQWYRAASLHDEWWDGVYDDADHCAELLGIDIAKHGKAPVIYFSGFWSQGDGACFEGSYAYKKGATKSIREYASNDAELHRIADALQKVQARHFYKLTATMVHRGHYNHSGCMSVDVEHADDRYRDIGDAEDDIRQLMRDFADWIYKQLENEYDYQNADAQVDENIRCNEYEFTEEGDIA